MDILEMNLRYSMFVTEEYVRQAEYQRYLDECVLIGINENTREKIDIINESFADSIKNGIKKLWNAIVKMWHKFLEGMNTLFRTDKGYLEKYKDIITKKKFPEGSKITMHNYPEGIKRLVSAKIPAFNSNELDNLVKTASGANKNEKGEINQEEVELALKKKYFNVYYDGKFDNDDNVKTYLRGGTTAEKEIDASVLNMTDVYNYCHDCDNLVKSIENSTKALQSDVDKILSYLDTKLAAVRKEETNESTYYSAVYGVYVNEAEVNVGGNDNKENKPSDNKADPSPSVKVSVGNRNQSGENDTEGVQKNIDAKEEKSGEDEYKQMAVGCKAFLSVCGGFLGVKLTVAKEIYTLYMTIIKELVRAVTGNAEAKDRDSIDSGTEYDGTKDNVKAKNQEQKKSGSKDNKGIDDKRQAFEKSAEEMKRI